MRVQDRYFELATGDLYAFLLFVSDETPSGDPRVGNRQRVFSLRSHWKEIGDVRY